VNTNEPDGTYEFSWEFELTKPQEELLKLNSAEMVSAACDHGTGTYRFAYSDYQDPVASSEMQRRLVPGA
jgi:hypothetical protein